MLVKHNDSDSDESEAKSEDITCTETAISDISDSDKTGSDLSDSESRDQLEDQTKKVFSNDVSDSDKSGGTDCSGKDEAKKESMKLLGDELEESANIFNMIDDSDVDKISKYKDFIKEHFLVNMPTNFYNFWNFCKKLKSSNPLEALKDVGLHLVGPFDVLAGKTILL